jgi:hypothetical protein
MIRISNTLIAYASFLVAIILILHHGYKHRPGGKDPLYGLDQYFQLSDVGNFRTFNHEMFVIFFTVIGIGILFYSRLSL